MLVWACRSELMWKDVPLDSRLWKEPLKAMSMGCEEHTNTECYNHTERQQTQDAKQNISQQIVNTLFQLRHYHKGIMIVFFFLIYFNRSFLFSLHLAYITVPLAVHSTNGFLTAASWDTERKRLRNKIDLSALWKPKLFLKSSNPWSESDMRLILWKYNFLYVLIFYDILPHCGAQ